VKRLADRSIEKFKDRCIAQGFSQYPSFDFDEIYTSVIWLDSLLLFLAITVVQGWRPWQADIKSTFLYVDLEEGIYMTLLEGHR
jgi:hypothetical protein